MSNYKPLMPKKEIEKRKKWQEKIYQNLKSIKRKEIKILGKRIIILPGVFAPLWTDPILLAKTIKKEINNNDTVLDLGTGTGIQAIFAAEKACFIIATDINPIAIKCSKLNIQNLKIKNKIKVIKSDLFSKIKKKFDLIIFNPPFRWFKPKDLLEKGELDENYNTLNKFFKNAKKFLNKKGRIILVFSDSGDLRYFKFLIKKYKFKSKILAKQKTNGWNYFVFKLIPKSQNKNPAKKQGFSE